jgi:hypothetical protein
MLLRSWSAAFSVTRSLSSSRVAPRLTRLYSSSAPTATAIVTGSEKAELLTPEQVQQQLRETLLAMELPGNDNIELLKMRHTSAHVMAMAVQRVYPDVKVTIGPWIDNG